MIFLGSCVYNWPVSVTSTWLKFHRLPADVLGVLFPAIVGTECLNRRQHCGLKTHLEARKLQFLERCLLISDRGDHGCSAFFILSISSSKMGIFSPEFCIFGRKFSKELKANIEGYWGGDCLLLAPPPQCAWKLCTKRHSAAAVWCLW